MTSKPETTLVRKIRAALQEIGAETIKIHGSVFSRIGDPDLVICYQGRFIGLEIKHPDENHPVSPAQIHRLQLFQKAGARVGVVDTVQDALDITKGTKVYDFDNARLLYVIKLQAVEPPA